MRRREFTSLLVVGAAAPGSAFAQPSSAPVVGFLRSGSAQESAHLVEAFRRGLGEHGFIEGRNVAVEYRWGDGRYDQLAKLAAELTQRNVAVIAASGGLAAAGGLLSYGPSYADLFRRAALYLDKILKGAKPADLPVEQPTKFELALNLKTAKAMAFTFLPTFLVRADGVIE